MPARTSRGLGRLSEEWRERIKVGVILQRLNDCAAGELEMGPDQIAAAKILLGKVLPDVKAMELSGPDGGPMSFETFLVQLVQRVNNEPKQLEPPSAD